jgi:hypothetical protein
VKRVAVAVAMFSVVLGALITSSGRPAEVDPHDRGWLS